MCYVGRSPLLNPWDRDLKGRALNPRNGIHIAPATAARPIQRGPFTGRYRAPSKGFRVGLLDPYPTLYLAPSRPFQGNAVGNLTQHGKRKGLSA